MKASFPPHSLVQWKGGPEPLDKLAQFVQDNKLVCTGWGPHKDGFFKFMVGGKSFNREVVDSLRDSLPEAVVTSIFHPLGDVEPKAITKYILVDLHRFGAMKHGYLKEGDWVDDPREATLMSKEGCNMTADAYGAERRLGIPYSMPVEVYL